MTATPKRRWYQFSLRTLLAGMTVLAVALGVGLLLIEPTERQRAVVKRVVQLGGTVVYADAPVNESWVVSRLREWLPRDYFDPVIVVDLDKTEAEDGDLAGLESLGQLQRLWLERTHVTDAGMVHLQGLTRLERLFLERTQVSDAGLAHLTWLGELKVLWLVDTKVTDAGLGLLPEFKYLERLNLADTQVTDAGLIHLGELTHLEILSLLRTRVTDAGVARLRHALPRCSIGGRGS